MLSYIFSDPLMGSRFVQRFKVEKFDLRKEVVLGGNLELWFKAKVRETLTFAMCLRL
jgi:hypothetical protein